jgi:hypothetical protein
MHRLSNLALLLVLLLACRINQANCNSIEERLNEIDKSVNKIKSDVSILTVMAYNITLKIDDETKEIKAVVDAESQLINAEIDSATEEIKADIGAKTEQLKVLIKLTRKELELQMTSVVNNRTKDITEMVDKQFDKVLPLLDQLQYLEERLERQVAQQFDTIIELVSNKTKILDKFNDFDELGRFIGTLVSSMADKAFRNMTLVEEAYKKYAPKIFTLLTEQFENTTIIEDLYNKYGIKIFTTLKEQISDYVADNYNGVFTWGKIYTALTTGCTIYIVIAVSLQYGFNCCICCHRRKIRRVVPT